MTTMIKAIKSHILESITDYDGNSFSDPVAAALFLSKTFHSEYGHNLSRMTPVKACKEYLQGLPSVCTIHFSNYDIYQFLKDSGVCSEKDIEKDDGEIIDAYWSIAGHQLAKIIWSV